MIYRLPKYKDKDKEHRYHDIAWDGKYLALYHHVAYPRNVRRCSTIMTLGMTLESFSVLVSGQPPPTDLEMAHEENPICYS